MTSSTLDADVLIVGAGPTGLTLAAALAARGIHALIVDRQAEGANTSRAAVIHARTLEVLEPLQVVPALTAHGLRAQRFTIRDRDRVLVPIGFENLPTAYPYTLMLSQAVTERLLLERLQALGGTVLRPAQVASIAQGADAVQATLDDGRVLRARYLVGCDGMHSRVREQSGIAFRGGSYGESFLLADVRLEGGVPQREVILFFSRGGMCVVAPLPDGQHRIVAPVVEAPEQPDRDDVQRLLDARGPSRDPIRVASVIWGSRFRVHHRVADQYRRGRVVLAGDAAHVHSPAGGQGMNMGILDAMLLAESLEASLRGDASALDRYAESRRPVAHEVVNFADRLTRLATVPAALRPVRNLILAGLASVPAFRRRLAWRLSGLVFR